MLEPYAWDAFEQATYPRTNVFKYSFFFHKITDQWNQLPLDTRASDNVNIFKSRVRKFFSDF